MTPGRREQLVLRMPADPALARLVRLVSLHFFRQNGVRAAAVRREAALVETRCRSLLRASGRSRSRAARRRRGLDLVMTLVSGLGELEVKVRRSDGSRHRRILRLGRAAAS